MRYAYSLLVWILGNGTLILVIIAVTSFVGENISYYIRSRKRTK